MENKTNAYEVLRLCREDPNYDHEHFETDIIGHVAAHMGQPLMDVNHRMPWDLYINHIGMAEMEYSMHVLCVVHTELSKDAALRKFAELILAVHGPDENEGVPENLRLL